MSKGLKVRMRKTKVMFCGPNLNTLKDSGKYPSCGVCCSGVGRNSIFCNGCSHWVHKRCSNIHGRLTADAAYRCSSCPGNTRPFDAKVCDHVVLENQKIEVVDSFCYLGNNIVPRGGCEAATVTRSRCAWGKFKERAFANSGK